MCRNIKTLYNFDPPAAPDEIQAAALQFVRKISGFQRPSKANEEAFLAAVHAITEAIGNAVELARNKRAAEESGRRISTPQGAECEEVRQAGRSGVKLPASQSSVRDDPGF